MTEQVAVETKKPKHIIQLEENIEYLKSEAREFMQLAQGYPDEAKYYLREAHCVWEEIHMFEDQLAYELKFWDGDPEAERHIPFSKDTL